MSNAHNEAIMERLYEEAREELYGAYWIHTEEQMHEVAVELAKKRWAFDYD